MFKYGLKLWSINTDYYLFEALKLYESGVFDYIELYVVPESLKELKQWEIVANNHKIPFVIHAPHFMHGFNLAKAEKKDFNKKIYVEVKTFADTLNAEHIIFHGGIDGNIEETAKQLASFNEPRALIENKPYVAIPNRMNGEFCRGYNIEEIKTVIDEANCGFCLDFGHAVCAANSLFDKLAPTYLKECCNNGVDSEADKVFSAFVAGVGGDGSKSAPSPLAGEGWGEGSKSAPSPLAEGVRGEGSKSAPSPLAEGVRGEGSKSAPSPLAGEGWGEGFKPAIHFYSQKSLNYSKELRKNMTDAETILWYYLRNRQLNGLKFRRQEAIDDYIADFVCYEHKLIIELDGGGHLTEEQKTKDKTRDKYLTSKGFKILRVYNTDIYENIEGVLDTVLNITTPHPNPLPQGARENLTTPHPDPLSQGARENLETPHPDVIINSAAGKSLATSGIFSQNNDMAQLIQTGARMKFVYDYCEKFLELNPAMFHLTDITDMTSPFDSHPHIGEGKLDIKRVLKLIPNGKKITVETVKNSKLDLADFEKDMDILKSM